jgi:hypothetical protein
VSKVHGIELVAEHTEGTFTGYSIGALTGGWVAVVDHTRLDPNARITGGTFTLITGKNEFDRPLTGRFTGGTVTTTNPGTNCTNQTFNVVGKLTHFNGNHAGRFSVKLTHYRHQLLGDCLTYFATASGTLRVTP